MMYDTNMSEIARIKQQIALQYQAAARVFTDFTATARHAYLTAYQEKLGLCLDELTQYMSPEDAMRTFIQAQTEMVDLLTIDASCDVKSLAGTSEKLSTDS